MRTAARLPRKLELPAHPRFKGFQSFAEREIVPHLAEKEAERRAALRRAKLTGGATALIVALLPAVSIGVLEWGALFSMFAFGLVPAIVGGFLALLPLARFQSSIGDFLLAKTCAHLGLRHTGAAPALSLERFHAARLLPQYDSHHFEDGIEGDAPDLAFRAAEASITQSRSNSDGGPDEETAWRGLLVEVPAPRRFQGRTLVIPARGAVERFFDQRDAERISLGLGELEEGLEIRTTDPGEARAVLTERVMRRLAELARRLGRERPALALIDDSVLLAIASERDRFRAASAFAPVDAAPALERLAADIAQLLDLAEALGDALGPPRASPGLRSRG